MLLARVNTPVTVQFALYNPTTRQRASGEAANLTAQIWVDDGVGGRSLTALAAMVTELSDDLPGEYYVTFTPDTAGRVYVVTVRHEAWGIDLAEQVQTELDAMTSGGGGGEVSQYLVSMGGEPWNVDEPIGVDLTFLNRQTLSKLNPFAIRQAELIARDAETILETVLGAAFENTGLGQRRVTFASVPNPGIYYLRVHFTGSPGDEEAVQIWGLQVLHTATEIVAGVMSVDELKAVFMAQVDGEPDKTALLKDDDGNLLVTDAALAAYIRQEAHYVEKRLDLSLTTVRYATLPGIPVEGALVKGQDYDEEEDRYDWQSAYTAMHRGRFSLRHTPVQKLTRVRAIYGQTPIYEFPVRWFQLNRRQGTVHIVVDMGHAESIVAAVHAGSVLQAMHDWWGRQALPMYWAFDYEAGLTEDQLTDDIKAVIGWRALAKALTVAGAKANKMGVQSQSVAQDGVSRNVTVADGRPGGRYARLLQSPIILEWTSEEKLDRMRALVRPGIRLF